MKLWVLFAVSGVETLVISHWIENILAFTRVQHTHTHTLPPAVNTQLRCDPWGREHGSVSSEISARINIDLLTANEQLPLTATCSHTHKAQIKRKNSLQLLNMSLSSDTSHAVLKPLIDCDKCFKLRGTNNCMLVYLIIASPQRTCTRTKIDWDITVTNTKTINLNMFLFNSHLFYYYYIKLWCIFTNQKLETFTV